MKKALTKLSAFVLVIALTILCFPAQALAIENDENEENTEPEVLYAVITDSDIPYSDSLNYGVVLPNTAASTAALDANARITAYSYLDSLLSNHGTTQYNAAGISTKTYTASFLDGVTISNLGSIVEIAKIENGYNLAYKSVSDEFVSIDYMENGDTSIYVNPDGSKDVVDEDTRIIIFSSNKNSVSELHFSPDAPKGTPSPAAVKQVDFPRPTSCGFSDTGASGTYSYHSRTVPYLGASRTVRLATLQTDFTPARSGWISFAANTALSVIGAVFSLPLKTIEVVLLLAGIIIDGVGFIQEAIRIANTKNYTATCGYYGDIYDSTAYRAYVRVVFNLVSVNFAGGESASGGFTYVKQYPINGPTEEGTISKTVTNYNSALVLGNGYNSAYTPPV